MARHDSGVILGELSARKTNQGIVANAIHSFDAAFCQIVVARMGMKDAPVLTNHDCFATTPSTRAGCTTCCIQSCVTRSPSTGCQRFASQLASGIHLSDPPDRGTLLGAKSAKTLTASAD